MTKKYFAIASAGIALVAILLVTLGPSGWRPRTGYDQSERIAAFALLGALAFLALRFRPVLAVLAVALFAFGLELSQAAIPGRHPELLTAILKTLGSLLGCLIASLGLEARTEHGRVKLRQPRHALLYACAFLTIGIALRVCVLFMNKYGAEGIKFPFL